MHVLSQHSKSDHEEIVLHDDKIENVDHFKLLGIWIDKKKTLTGRKIQMKNARK